MKKPTGSNMKVMLALFAVLIISLGYLSYQSNGRESMSNQRPKTETETEEEEELKKKSKNNGP